MYIWHKPTPGEVQASRLTAGFDSIAAAAKAFGVSYRTWHSWELPPEDPSARQMSPRDWKLWRIMNKQEKIGG